MATVYKIGTYTEEEKFLDALRSLHDRNIPVFEAYTPYPVHEVFHLLERKSKLPTAAYFFGLFGAAATLAFLYFTSVISWPITYGGKPFNSFPSFIVVTIVLTIFVVTIASLGLFSFRSKIFPGRENTIFRPDATDDKFVIVVGPVGENQAMIKESDNIFNSSGAIEVTDKNIEKILL